MGQLDFGSVSVARCQKYHKLMQVSDTIFITCNLCLIFYCVRLAPYWHIPQWSDHISKPKTYYLPFYYDTSYLTRPVFVHLSQILSLSCQIINLHYGTSIKYENEIEIWLKDGSLFDSFHLFLHTLYARCPYKIQGGKNHNVRNEEKTSSRLILLKKVNILRKLHFLQNKIVKLVKNQGISLM